MNDNAETYLRPLTEILEQGINDGVVKGIAWQNRAEGWFSNKDGVPWADAVIHKYDDAFKVWKDFLVTNIVTSVEDDGKQKKSFRLNQNYPNPFNPATNIKFNLLNREKVLLKVYDTLGREIQTLVDDVLMAGEHEVEFSGKNLSSGIYFYTLALEQEQSTKKMVLIR